MYQQGPSDSPRSVILTEEQQSNLAMMTGVDPEVNGQGWPAQNPLLIGTRPSFAASTFTTIQNNQLEMVTKPLVSSTTAKSLPQPSSSTPASAVSSHPLLSKMYNGPKRPTSPANSGISAGVISMIPGPADGMRHLPRAQYFDSSVTKSGSPSIGLGYRSMKKMHGPPSLPLSSTSAATNGTSLPAGLLTPPLSPLFRSDNTGVVATQTPTVAMTVIISGPAPQQAPRPSFQSFPSNHARVLSHPPTQLQHSFAVSGPSVSYGSPATYSMVPTRAEVYRPQQQQQQQQHSMLNSRASMEDRSRTNFTRSPSSSSSVSPVSSTKAGLPSPPQSPTLSSDGFVTMSTVSNNTPGHSSVPTTATPVSPPSSTSLSSSTSSTPSSTMMSAASKSAANHIKTAAARAPVMTRHSMDDLRRTPSTSSKGHGKTKSKLNSGGGSHHKEEEEDLPLAMVQRRLSSDMLRSM